MRVARPLTAAASGTVASTTSWPSRSAPLRLVSVSDWLRKGTQSTTTSALVAASAFSKPSNRPSGRAARARSASSTARSASREPSTMGTPARPQRSVRPKPSAPVGRMMAMGSLKGGEYMFTVAVSDLPHSVRISEVSPRDRFKNEPEVAATDDKVALIDALMRTGLRRIEATSFVRADVIPQLADADEVLARIDRPDDVSVSVLIPNERGLRNALVNHGRFQEINVFLSATETHNRKNVNRSIRESLTSLERVLGHAREEGLRCEAVISVAFGCPYEGHVAPERVLEIAGRLVRAGAQEVGFGDTTGMANPLQVRAFFEQARTVLDDHVELTAHFHNPPGQVRATVPPGLVVAIDSLESSFGELGGCPVPPGATGNIATEGLVSMLHEMGYTTGIDLERLLECAREVQRVLGRPLTGHLLTAGPVDWHEG